MAAVQLISLYLYVSVSDVYISLSVKDGRLHRCRPIDRGGGHRNTETANIHHRTLTYFCSHLILIGRDKYRKNVEQCAAAGNRAGAARHAEVRVPD